MLSQLHVVCAGLTVTFSSSVASLTPQILLGRSPVGSQHPCGLVSKPIQPVMDSRRLSAAGIRFLRLPLPTGDFGLPCGWLTDFSDPSGITTFHNSRRNNWFRCLLYCVGLVSTSSVRQNWFHFLLGESKSCPNTLVTTIFPRLIPNAASTKDSSSSPCQFFPGPGVPVWFGTDHWALPSAITRSRYQGRM